MKKGKLKKLVGAISTAAITTSLLVGCGTSSSNTTNAANSENSSTTSASVANIEETTTTTASSIDTDWPKKDITIIVPYNAGGDTDFHAREFAQYASKILGVNIVVENVAGANGTTGMLQMMDSDPDGYTCLFFHDSMLTNYIVGTADVNYTDIKPCAATIVDNSYVMAVNKNSGWTTLDDVVNAAKAKPGKLIYASSVGGYSYYLGRQLEELSDIDFNIVDAGGGTDRNAALLAGTIDTNVNPYGVMKSYFDSGDFVPVCTIADDRNDLFPDVATAKEQGYDWTASRYYFLSFPKDTDDAIVAKMADVAQQVCGDKDFIKDTQDAYCVTPTFVGTQDLIAHLDTYMKDFTEHKDLINN